MLSDVSRTIPQDNDFEQDVQTALVHTDKVRPIQHLSQRCDILPAMIA